VTAKDAIMNNPGGGTIHSSQKVEAAAVVTEEKETPKTNVEEVKEKKEEEPSPSPSPSSSSSSSEKVESLPVVAAPTPVLIEEEPVSFTVGEKISALWTDGKWYPGIIKSYNEKLGKYSVTYTGYGNTASLPLSSMKKLAAPVANGQNGNKRNQSNDRQASNKPRAAAAGNARRDVNRR